MLAECRISRSCASGSDQARHPCRWSTSCLFRSVPTTNSQLFMTSSTLPILRLWHDDTQQCLRRPCRTFAQRVVFFQAEDGIRDLYVTGVQTCALLFSSRRRHTRSLRDWSSDVCSSD